MMDMILNAVRILRAKQFKAKGKSLKSYETVGETL